MRGRQSLNPNTSPVRALRTQLLVLFILPFLGGCLPGNLWGGDDDSGRSSFAEESSGNGPALTRSDKTGFLSLKMPSFGAAAVDTPPSPAAGSWSALPEFLHR